MTAVAPAATAGKPPPAPTSVVQFSPSGTALTSTEGQPSAVSVVLTRSSSAGTATFNLDAIPGSATAADYSPGWSNPVTIAAGSTTRTLLLNIVNDTDTEPTESMQLKLTNPTTGTQIGKKNTATVTIFDNDPCSPVSVNDSSNTEGSPITFTVSMAAACQLPVQVHYATASNGDATAGVDYTSKSGNVAIAAGDTSATFQVATLPDTTDETNQTFNVNLSAPVNTTIADGLGVGTINDNDAAPGVTMSDNPTVAEGNDLIYTITLAALSEQTASGTFETWPGNVADVRYVPILAGAWSITPGNLSTTVHVPTTDDAFSQASSTVWGHLLTATNAVIDTSFGGAFPDFSSDLALNDAWSKGTLQDNEISGYETGLEGWTVEQSGAGPLPAISTAQANSGLQSVLLGTDGVSGDEPGDGWSYLYKSVAVPTGTTTLSAWVLEQGDGNGNDVQKLEIKSSDGLNVLATPFNAGSNSNPWQQVTYDLSSFAGQTVFVLFSVYQDIPGGDPTAMWVDDVTISHTP
jgi:hypothetical protein